MLLLLLLFFFPFYTSHDSILFCCILSLCIQKRLKLCRVVIPLESIKESLKARKKQNVHVMKPCKQARHPWGHIYLSVIPIWRGLLQRENSSKHASVLILDSHFDYWQCCCRDYWGRRITAHLRHTNCQTASLGCIWTKRKTTHNYKV